MDVASCLPVRGDRIHPVGDQAAAGNVEAIPVDRGQFVPDRKRDDEIAMKNRQRTPCRDQAAVLAARECRDGALDLAGVPYVGSGVSGSAIGMDKVVARELCDAQGLPSVRWIAFDAASRTNGALSARHIAAELAFPVFVKPANGGSSVGVTRVMGPSGLAAAIEEAFACDTRIIVEQGVDAAREIECAVLGNERPEPSVLGEIVPSREFYDYAAKYLEDSTELKIPAPLEPELAQTIRAHAVSAFRALGLAGLARVDFLLDPRGGQVYLNEVNTLPGFTSISMFPKLWEASGLSFPRLVTRLVELALARWEESRPLRSSWKPA